MTTIPDTVPYAWPYDGLFRPDRTTLVLTGVQCAMAALGDRDATAAAVAVMGVLASSVREAGGAVVWVRHGSRAPVRGTPLPVTGSAQHALLLPTPAGDHVVDAAGWDGCFSSDLDHLLRLLDTRAVLLAGLASELTVDSTVRALNDRGHECLVLTDACVGADADLAAHAQHSLTMSGGIFGALGTSSAVLPALSRKELPGPPVPSPQIRTPGPTTAPSTPDARRCCASTGRRTSAVLAGTSTPWATT